MRKNNSDITIIFVVIGIAVLFLVVIPNINKEKSNGLKIHYYSNGQEVFPNDRLFSIVNGGNYDSISFSITLQNTGQTPLNNLNISYIQSTSNTNQLTNNLVKWNPYVSSTLSSDGFYYQDLGTLGIGAIQTLYSDNVTLSQFENLSQPIKFYIKTNAIDSYTNNLITSNSSASLSITPKVSLWCYQESANIANQGGKDGSCGLSYNGNYNVIPYYFMINYTKPINSNNNSIWIFSGSQGPLYYQNITPCWDSTNILQLKVYSDAWTNYGTLQLYCYNNGWINLYNFPHYGARTTTSKPGDFEGNMYDGNWGTGAWSSIYNTGSTWANVYNMGGTVYEEAMNWSIG